jgi:exoribonuclease R
MSTTLWKSSSDGFGCFSSDVIEETERLPERSLRRFKKRCAAYLLTIDQIDKDFDYTISFRELKNEAVGWVHIADVNHCCRTGH